MIKTLKWSGIILAGLLIYGRTFRFDFVFDDFSNIVNDPYIKNFSHIHLIWHSYPMTRLVGIYSFALNYFFDQLHPQGYHIFNFIVHLVSVGLVWALADVLFKITRWLPSKDRLTRELPFFIAVLFLVHPCQTQAVSYITQRFESMATVFYLGTIYCYLCARLSTGRTRKIILFGLSGLLTILGILTKEVVITVPAMILASEWILFPKKGNKKLYIILAVGGILLYLLFTKLVYTDLRIFLRSTLSQSHEGDLLTPLGYFLTQMRVFLTFLRLLVLPIHQNLDYDYPASTGLLQPPLTLVGLCVIGCIISLIIKLRRSVPLIAFGLAWMLITFSINLAPRANVIFEHKLYLISFGFILAIVAALSILVRNRGTLVWILSGMITVLAIVTCQRNKVWQNEFTLWNDIVQKSPHKARPYNERGLAYAQQGNYTQAISDYNKAIEINPGYVKAYNNLGLAYFQQGNYTQALSDYNKAIEIDPDYAEAYNNRGHTYFQQGNYTQALSDYNKAIEIDPDYATAYNNRGVYWAHQGSFKQAMSDYNKAIEIDPNYAKAYYNLAFIYYTQGDLTGALSDYNKAIEIDLNIVEAYIGRGNVYSREGEHIKALSDYNKAIEIDPDYAGAYYDRAVTYYHLKEYDKARSDLHKAEKLGYVVNPKYLNALKARE